MKIAFPKLNEAIPSVPITASAKVMLPVGGEQPNVDVTVPVRLTSVPEFTGEVGEMVREVVVATPDWLQHVSNFATLIEPRPVASS